MSNVLCSYRCNEESGILVDHGNTGLTRYHTREPRTWNGRPVLGTRVNHPKLACHLEPSAANKTKVLLDSIPVDGEGNAMFVVNGLADVTWDGGARTGMKIKSMEPFTLEGGAGSQLPLLFQSDCTIRKAEFVGVNIGKLDFCVPNPAGDSLTIFGVFAFSAWPAREYLWSKGALGSECVHMCSIQRQVASGGLPTRIVFTLFYMSGFSMTPGSISLWVPTTELGLNKPFLVRAVFDQEQEQAQLIVNWRANSGWDEQSNVAGIRQSFSTSWTRAATHLLPDKQLILGSRGTQEAFKGSILGFEIHQGDPPPTLHMWDLLDAARMNLPHAWEAYAQTWITSAASIVPELTAVEQNELIPVENMMPGSAYWARPWYDPQIDKWEWLWSSDHSADGVSGCFTGVSDSPMEFPATFRKFIHGAETPHWNEMPDGTRRLTAHSVVNWGQYPEWNVGQAEAGQITRYFEPGPDDMWEAAGDAVPFAHCQVPMEPPAIYTHTGYFKSLRGIGYGSGMSGTQYGAVRSFLVDGGQFIINADDEQLSDWDGMLCGDQCEWWSNVLEGPDGRLWGVGRGRVSAPGRPAGGFLVALSDFQELSARPRRGIYWRLLNIFGQHLGPANPDILDANLSYIQDIRAMIHGEFLHIYVLYGYKKAVGISKLVGYRYSLPDPI